jgi:hypothetical protein
MLITPDGMSTEAELSRPLSRCPACGKTNDRVCGECTCKKQEPEPSADAIASIHAADALSDEEIAEQFGHASAEPPKPSSPNRQSELPRMAAEAKLAPISASRASELYDGKIRC